MEVFQIRPSQALLVLVLLLLPLVQALSPCYSWLDEPYYWTRPCDVPWSQAESEQMVIEHTHTHHLAWAADAISRKFFTIKKDMYELRINQNTTRRHSQTEEFNSEFRHYVSQESADQSTEQEAVREMLQDYITEAVGSARVVRSLVHVEERNSSSHSCGPFETDLKGLEDALENYICQMHQLHPAFAPEAGRVPYTRRGVGRAFRILQAQEDTFMQHRNALFIITGRLQRDLL